MVATGERARIAIVGTGWWSTFVHIPGLIENPDAELVAAVDTDPAALERCAAVYAVGRTYTDLDEMISREKPEGAVIAVPHARHYEVARKCLEHDLHVMLEKPMVLTAGEGRALIELARERQRELIVGYPWHFAPVSLRAREMVQAGQLGRVQQVACLYSSMVIEFYRGKESAYEPHFQYPVRGPGTVYADPALSGGGQGHLQVTHSAALTMFISGLRAERVSAYMNTFGLPVDLVDAISVQFEGGAVGTFASTGNVGVGDEGQLEIRIYGEKGYLLLDAIRGGLKFRGHDGSEESFTTDDAEAAYPRFATAGNLVDVCRGEGVNGSPAEIALACVEILDAAYRSAETPGKSVTVSELYGGER